jgi:HPr kinase/phosphorylase
MSRATVAELYRALREKLGLKWVAGIDGQGRTLKGDFPGAASQGLAGSLNCIHPNRIQLIGHAELVYFTGLEKEFFLDTLKKLFDARPAAILLTDGIGLEDEFIEYAERTATPVLSSTLGDSRLVNELQYYLNRITAERLIVHGVFLEVLGIGVLLTGDSAVGKSELALELISRGHRLIADDAPEFSLIGPEIIDGTCPEVLKDFLEVRGLGLLNIRAMFGDSAIMESRQLQFIIDLRQMSEDELGEIDRLGGSYTTRLILDLEIPMVTLPVAPGRELAVLVEAAVRQYALKQKGYDAAEDFIARQKMVMAFNSRREDAGE